MAKSKYEKQIMRDPLTHRPGKAEPSFHAGFDGLDCSIVWDCISKPVFMEKEPHKHSFEQILCFMGGDPMNIAEFDAEIELSLGADGEKLIITSPTAVHIPKGFIHCPLDFKRVDKPVMFMYTFLADEYKQDEMQK